MSPCASNCFDFFLTFPFNDICMKYFGLLLIYLSAFYYSDARAQTHIPKPKAKAMEDSAISKYQRSAGEPEKMKEVFKLLDNAVKEDNLYREGWINKMTLECQVDQFETALRTLKRMEQFFPKDLEVQFHTGILLYKTGKTKESIAMFNKQLDEYNTMLKTNPKSPNAKGWMINKGIVLILADRDKEGKAILTKIYNEEKEYYQKSYLAFYINSSKQEIIEDRSPSPKGSQNHFTHT
jgi:tetratricopeptide (TPR) repeat protein